jgi:quinohemoprotein ethanol dehydrogenase
VYAADTGAPLAHINVGTSIMAAPMSYSVAGEQYVAVMAGLGGAAGWWYPRDSAAYRYGNEGRIVAFRLGGGPVPVPPKREQVAAVAPPADYPVTPAAIERGRRLFDDTRCNWCHVNDGPGMAPDLLAMTPEKHSLFRQIVLGGILEGNGMAGFADLLSVQDADDIHAYLVDAARQRSSAARAHRP